MVKLKDIRYYLLIVVLVVAVTGLSSISIEAREEAAVVIYVATRCPISNAYNKRMADLFKEFKGKGIAFIGINSNKMEGAEEIKNGILA